MILGAILLGISAYLFFSILWRVGRRAKDRIRERYGIQGSRDLGDLVLALDARSLWTASIAAAMLSASLAFPIGVGVSISLFVSIAGGLPALALRHRRRWLAALESQLADGLGNLSAALRAGLSLQKGLEQLGEEAPRPLGREWRVVARETKLGLSLEEALENLSARVSSKDVDLVVVSIAVSRQLGGNLAETLDRIADTTRERIRLQGKTESLTAQGRMQAWILAGLPVLLGFAMAWMRPDLVEPMWRHPFGWSLAGAVACMELAGLFLIRRIVRIPI